jgi:membrane-bound lytic murein transglycosylase D
MLPRLPRNLARVFHAGRLLLLAAPLLLLAGCPDDASPKANPPKNATAPGLTGADVSGNTPAQDSAHTAANGQANAAAPAAVRQLIANVEGAYSAGLNNYRAGQIDAARVNFDRAMDLMLTSPLDIRNTPELSDEFDKILSGINTMEIATLQQGSGITQQVEISPAEEANDVTFPVDPNLRARAEAEIKTTQSELPLVINDPVASFISYFTNNRSGRATLLRSLERAGRYKELIQRILREEGVPQELIYQAVAESGFQPQAVNGRSGAGGMWQFMPGTGALYGLQRNAAVDERFDPEKATRAYARYMKDMYNQLGNWYLVMAGYDWGPGAVQHAVSKTGYADFWELYRRNNLPTETKNYVPIILAATIIAKNPEQYGFTDLHPLPSLAFDNVTTHQDVSLRLAADITGAQLEELVTLNPALRRLATPSDTSYDLHLPPGTKDLFTERLALIPSEHWPSWRFHTVAAGESLNDIAHTYHSDASQIASANQISGESLEEGQGLAIPVAAVVSSSASMSRVTQRYTTHKGDTLISVADRFGVTQQQLRTWNHLPAGNALGSGHVLQVASPALTHAAAHSRGRHGGSKSGATRASAARTGAARAGAARTGAARTGSATSGKAAPHAAASPAHGGKGSHASAARASKPAGKATGTKSKPATKGAPKSTPKPAAKKRK